MLEYMYICIQSRSLSSYSSMTAFDCSTLYTTNPHYTLKQIKRIGSALFHTNRMANIDTNRKRQILFGSKNYSDSNEIFSELASLRCSIFWFTTYIFVMISWRVFQNVVGIPMDTSCVPILAMLFLIRMK